MSRKAIKQMIDSRKLPPLEIPAKESKPKYNGLHVYAAFCCWSGTIDKAGKTKPEGEPTKIKGCSIPIPPVSLPCCPYCGSVLYQISEQEWRDGIPKHVAEGHANYDKFLEWKESQGRCWPTLRECAVDFTKATGLVVKFDL